MSFRELKVQAPQEVLDTEAKGAERVKNFLRSRKIQLGDQQRTEIEQDLQKKYDAWRKNTTTLRRKLTRLNDMLEGVVEETNSPFEGASNMTIHYSLGIARAFQSVFNKTMYQDPAIASPMVDPEAGVKPDELEQLEEAITHSFSVKSNGLDILKEGTIPCERDGTLIITGGWERKLETAHDTKTYSNFQDFQTDYPDAESAGIDEVAYQDLADQFIIDPDFEIITNYSYDFVVFDGIEYEITPLAKFIFWPSFARTIDKMELYGKEYTISKSDVIAGGKRGKYYKKAVEQVLASEGVNQWHEWERSRDFAEGLRTDQADYRPIVCADLVYKKDLNDDGIPEKYLVTWAPDHKVVLAMEHYPLRRNIDFCVDFRLASRENRFLGRSLIGDCEDLFNLMDGIHRHRNNIRLLVASPVLLANELYKDQIDLGRAENVIRPGLTFWCKDVDKTVKQLELRNFDQPGNSQDEESLITRYVELVFGPTQGLSGEQTKDDPHAPARKTQMLLMQANQRIDDYMDEFRKSIPRLIQLHCALLYQYSSGDKISFESDGTKMRLQKAVLANDQITWQAKRRSVTLTPEFAMARLSGLTQTYLELMQPLAMGDPIALELWNRQVHASGEPDATTLEKQAIPPELAQFAPGSAGMPPMGGGQPPVGQGGLPVKPNNMKQNQNQMVKA